MYLWNFSVDAGHSKFLDLCPGVLEKAAISGPLDKLLVRQRDEINTPEANEFLFGERRESVQEGVENRVAWRLDAVRNDDLSLAQ